MNEEYESLKNRLQENETHVEVRDTLHSASDVFLLRLLSNRHHIVLIKTENNHQFTVYMHSFDFLP